MAMTRSGVRSWARSWWKETIRSRRSRCRSRLLRASIQASRQRIERAVRVAVDAASQASIWCSLVMFSPSLPPRGRAHPHPRPPRRRWTGNPCRTAAIGGVHGVLDNDGAVADADYFWVCRSTSAGGGTGVRSGDLPLANQKTIPLCGRHTANPARRVQRLPIRTARATPRGTDKGVIDAQAPFVRVRHFSIQGSGWHDPRWPRFMVLRCQPQSDAESESGVLVLLNKPGPPACCIDRLLGEPKGKAASQDAYNQIGMGAQILRTWAWVRFAYWGHLSTMRWQVLASKSSIL